MKYYFIIFLFASFFIFSSNLLAADQNLFLEIKNKSQVETVLDGNWGPSGKNYNVWNGRDLKYEKVDSSEVFLMDGTSYTVLNGDWPMAVFANFRCFGENLTFNENAGLLYENLFSDNANFKNSWCQRLAYDSYYVSVSSLNPWEHGTRATWSAHFFDNKTLLINFTENKTLIGQDGINRRGNLNFATYGYDNSFEYINYKMDGSIADPTKIEPNTLYDGFYQGFITASYIDETLNNREANTFPIDLGPIIWPITGYRYWNGSGWQQTSYGVRHPRGFVDGGYLYIYYLGHKERRDNIDYGGNGIYVARALLKDINKKGAPGSFKCGKDFDEDCLPKNFKGWYDNKKGNASILENFQYYLSQTGPDVEPIFRGDTILSFAVAKVKDQDLYIGVQVDLTASQISNSIRFSNDLVNWSDPVVVPGTIFQTSYAEWNLNGILFPRFADGETGSAELIDPNNFYIVGNSGRDSRGKKCRYDWQCRIVRIKVEISNLINTDGKCGEVNGKTRATPWGIFDPATDTLSRCSVGKMVDLVNPTSSSQKWTWRCAGINGGKKSEICTLFNSVKEKEDKTQVKTTTTTNTDSPTTKTTTTTTTNTSTNTTKPTVTTNTDSPTTKTTITTNEVKSSSSYINGFIFHDLNGNGNLDSGEPRLQNNGGCSNGENADFYVYAGKDNFGWFFTKPNKCDEKGNPYFSFETKDFNSAGSVSVGISNNNWPKGWYKTNADKKVNVSKGGTFAVQLGVNKNTNVSFWDKYLGSIFTFFSVFIENQLANAFDIFKR